MKWLISAMLVFSLLLPLCGCRQFSLDSYTETEPSVTTQPTELTTPPTEAPTEETKEPVLTQGTVIAEKLPIFTGPGTEYEQCGHYLFGDYVEVYEQNGNWARTDLGWVFFRYIQIQDTPGPSFGQPPVGETQPGYQNPTEGTKPNTDPSLYEGYWYRYYENDGEIYIEIVEVYNGATNYYEELFSVAIENLHEVTPADSFNPEYESYRRYNGLIPSGGFWRSCKPDDFTFNGNVLIYKGQTYQRGTLDDLIPVLKAKYCTQNEPTEPPAGDNSALLGEWYRILQNDWVEISGRKVVTVHILHYTNDGRYYDSNYLFYLSDIDSWDEGVGMMAGSSGLYRVSGNTLIWKQSDYGGWYPEVQSSFSVSGNTLRFDGAATYYHRGGQAAAAAAIRQQFNLDDSSTEPSIEPSTEPSTEPATEPSTESDTESETTSP